MTTIDDLNTAEDLADYRKAVKAGRQKYNNRPTEVDGIRFDSMAEAVRYKELKLLEASGDITDLRVHERFEIVPAWKHPTRGTQHKAIYYEADFTYIEDGVYIIEDVKGGKGTQTRLWKLKWEMFQWRCRHNHNYVFRVTER